MSIYGTYQFGKITCLFEQFGDSNYFSSMSWMIDSYQVQANHYDLLVSSYHGPEIELSDFSILFKEQAGLFQRQILQNQNQLIYQLVRSSNQEIFIQYLTVDQNIYLVQDHSNTAGLYALNYLGHIIGDYVLQKGMLPIHSVLMEYQGKGIIISADSGVGKSTHARLWRDYQHALIINGDQSYTFLEDDHWKAIGLPWCGTSGEYINRTVDLQAIVMLKRGTVNKAYRIEANEALPQLLKQVISVPHQPIDTLTIFDQLDSLLSNLPIYQLECTISTEAVDVLKEVIMNG